jgi:hypothetical protein
MGDVAVCMEMFSQALTEKLFYAVSQGLPNSQRPSPAILLASYVTYVEDSFAKEKPQVIVTCRFAILDSSLIVRYSME